MKTDEPPALIITDLHRRITGVGATIRTLIPFIQKKLPLTLWSKCRHHSVPSQSLFQLIKLCRQPLKKYPFRIWHARRNSEMMWGLIMKYILRVDLRLVFTSAAIRRHSLFPRWLIRQMDTVIATSEQAASFVSNVAAVIGHGVDTERFHPGKSSIELPTPFAVGQIGRIRPEKGSDNFVHAMIKLLPKHPEWCAVIAGKATKGFEGFHQELKSKISEAGLEDRIIWLGEVSFEKVPELFRRLTIVAAPSRYEGYGLTVLEAMASGCAVAATETGAYRSMVKENQTGHVTPVGDQPAFVKALDLLMQDVKGSQAMGEAARERAVEFFSAESEAEKIMTVYQNLWESC